MNFVGHVVVAGRATPGAPTAHLVGAAAPDLVRMARLPMATAGPAPFRDGVAAHHRSDAAFHDSAWFRAHNRRLVGELKVAGVRRGPAWGAAHVLIELLLDGALLADPGPASAFAPVWAALAGPTDDALVAVDDEHHGPWRHFLDRLTTHLDPHAYADPTYAADRTAATLARRPRLALTPAEADVVRSCAERQARHITATIVDNISSAM